MGEREEGLEGGPGLHPAALSPCQRSCSPRGAVEGLRHRNLGATARQGLLTASSLSSQTKMHIFVTQAI